MSRATDIWKTWYELWLTGAEAQTVMTMRMMGMAGMWNVTDKEGLRMFSEKPEAFGQSMMAAGLAVATGQSPDRIMRDATRPIRKKTRSNARRLTQRGMI